MTAMSIDLPMGEAPRIREIDTAAHGPGILEYQLPMLYQLHLYPQPRIYVMNNEVLRVTAGSATITPPGARMRYHLDAVRPYTFVHFAAKGAQHAVPALVDLGREYRRLEAALQEAIPWATSQPERASARLWDILWQIVARERHDARDPVVAEALEIIERHITAPLRIAAIAKRIGVSQSQLERRFRAVQGVTVVGYVRTRRAQRAAYLIRHTNAPLVDVAAQLGIDDMQAFNKLMRGVYALSPRALRMQSRDANFETRKRPT